MWITRRAMRRLGFRRVSPRFWLCRGRYGLPARGHLTVADRVGRDLVELSAFHVTVEVGGERVHVYYREEAPACWGPEGHTPADDLLRLGVDRGGLLQTADDVARRLVEALRAHWMEEAGDDGGYRP